MPNEEVLDTAGNLFIADADSGLLELARGSQTIVQLALHNLTPFVTGLALDEHHGHLYISTVGNGNHYLDEYVFGSSRQLYHVPSVNADNIAFGSVGRDYVFVPDLFDSDIQVYKRNAPVPFEQLNVTTDSQAVAYKPPLYKRNPLAR
jgi:hypothetical protein